MPCPTDLPPPTWPFTGLVQTAVQKGWIPADSPAAARASLAGHFPTAVVPVPSFSAADIDREAADFARMTLPDHPSSASDSDQLQHAMVKYDMEMSTLRSRHDAQLEALQQAQAFHAQLAARNLRRAHEAQLEELERELQAHEQLALRELAQKQELERHALRARLTDEPPLVRSRADAIAAGERNEQQLRGFAAVFAYDRDVDHRYLVRGDADDEADAIRVVADADRVREADVIVIPDDDVFDDELTVYREDDSEEDDDSEDEKLARKKAFIEELRMENEQSPAIAFTRVCRVCYADAPRRRAAFTACGHIVCRACAEKLQLYADRDADRHADEEDDYADAREDMDEADDASVADEDLAHPIALRILTEEEVADFRALFAEHTASGQTLPDDIEAAANAPQADDAPETHEDLEADIRNYLTSDDEETEGTNAPEADDASDAYHFQEPHTVPSPIGSRNASQADDAPHAYSRDQETMREFNEAYDLPQLDLPDMHNHLFSNDEPAEDYGPPVDYELNPDAFSAGAYNANDADADADEARSLSCPLCRTVGGFVPLFEEEAEECW